MSTPFGISGADDPVDWDSLRGYATQVMERAYAPYSRYKVGVAGLVDDGRVVLGCNVENASYGVGLCAECGMVSALHATGGGRLVAVVCVDGHGAVLMPCGRCRQLLWENGGATMQLLTSSGVRTMDDVLPDAFGADDLASGEGADDLASGEGAADLASGEVADDLASGEGDRATPPEGDR